MGRRDIDAIVITGIRRFSCFYLLQSLLCFQCLNELFLFDIIVDTWVVEAGGLQ